ncbi:phage tail tape measure protein [Polaribacter atrinae]|uniref:phage tail tape measure protein n=1 Tax=Polaribacter atrinae TaxID=1333662 RepID=UPI0030F56389
MAKFITDENIRLNIIVNGNDAQKELLDLEKSTRNLNTTQKALRAEKTRLISAGKKESIEYKNVTAEINKNNATLKLNKARMEALQKEIGLTGLTMKQLKSRASVLRLALNNAIPGGADAKRWNAELQAIGTRLDQLKQKGNQTKLSLSGIANGFNKYAALGASVIATTTGIALGMQKMIDYNGKLSDAQSDVQKTTGLTKVEVDELTKSFGILNTRTSRLDLLKIAEEGGRIGIVKDEIQDFVAVMNKANVALGDSFSGGVEEVASKLGKLKLLFKETKDIGVEKAYESIGSAINELGANGVATESNIASFATRVGSLPDALKPTIQDALGLGAAFEESGIQAEISGRSYSIFLGEAAKSSDKFAEVMGITTAEVENLINTNPTEFFLQFAQRLDETSKGGVDTAKTLAKLGLSADGVKKIVGAAGNNVARFREILDLSNKSMIAGTSLTNEYDIKNNNLAATIDKVSKKLRGAFSSEAVTNGLNSLVTWVGRLIGAIKDVNEEFALQNKQTFESAINNRRLANESQNLLDKYKALTKDGIKPTAKEKVILDGIVLQLKDRLGESVIAIDKETGSYQLNTDAVKEQIKLKRLAADEEAATLISRVKGTEVERNSIKETIPNLEKEAAARKLLSDQARQNFINSEEYEKMNKRARASAVANLPEVLADRDAFLTLSEAKGAVVKQEVARLNLLKQLKALNYTEADVDNFFKDTSPKEGAEKFIGNTKFIFTNGSWVAQKSIKPTDGPGGDGDGDGDGEMTDEDKAIAASKKKLAEFLEEWHSDQDLQNELKKFEKEQREEQEEILRLENRYLKMAEDAGFETILEAGLEDAKNQEIQAVKDKWTEIRLEKKAAEDARYKKLDEKQKAALIAADAKLEAAKKQLQEVGLNTLANVFGKKTALYKLIFGLEKALAIKDIVINTQKANAQITSNLAIANMKAVAASPLTGGLPFVGINSAIASKETLTNNINAGVQIAGIVGETVAGFEDGLYPVTREQDGKLFNAKYGGETKTGMVYEPTLFSSSKGNFLAGEKGRYEPELIVDGAAFKQIDPSIKSSFMREISRVKGFESGYYQQQSKPITEPLQDTELPGVTTSNTEMVAALNRASAIFEKIENQGIIAYMSDDLRNMKKIKEGITDYESLVKKNQR